MARVVIDRWGAKRYYNDEGQLHRTDGPASIASAGSKSWYVNGEWNDVTKPSIIGASGVVLWYKVHHHRSNGPSEDRPNGYKEWYTDGEIIWPKL